MTSLRNRILFFFTLFAVVALTAIYLSGRSTRIVGKAARSVADEHLPMVRALGQMDVALGQIDNAIYRYTIMGEKKWKDVFEKERITYTRHYMAAEALSQEETEQDKLQAIDEAYVQYENIGQKILHTPTAQRQVLVEYLARGNEYLLEIKGLINQIEDFRNGMTVVRKEQIHNTLNRHNRITYYFLLLVIIFFGILGAYLLYYLVRPLSLLMQGIRHFTRGHVDVQIPPVGKDELGELQEAFNEMSREIAVERKRLKTESQSDPLTGLFNMRYFRMQLADEFSRSQRYAHPLTLLMIDVDYFKVYNDRNGHPAGDIVLKEVSRILIRNVRGTDVVARYGGEEFVIMLPETTLDAARKVAEKIRKTVEVHHFPFQEKQGFGKLTVSVGVAAYPHPHITCDQDLIESSDKALYQAKRNGRNTVCRYTDLISSTSPEKHSQVG